MLNVVSSQFHDTGHEFNMLTQVDLKYFFHLFFNVILKHKVDLELNFIIYFNLLFIKLSQFYNLNNKFNMLTLVDINLARLSFFSLVFSFLKPDWASLFLFFSFSLHPLFSLLLSFISPVGISLYSSLNMK